MAEDANNAGCGGLTIVSLDTSRVSSAISGEFATYSFDLTATIENAGDAALPAAEPMRVAKLASGDKELATLEIAALEPKQQVTVKAKIADWSPYTDHGFKISISPSDDTCSLEIDGTAMEQVLRGQ